MAAIQKQNAQLVSAAELDNLRTQADVNRALVEAGRTAWTRRWPRCATRGRRSPRPRSSPR
jgi:hypothetical protein